MNATSYHVKYKSSLKPHEIIFLAKVPGPVLGMNFNCVPRVSECYVSKWWSVYFMPHLQAVFSSNVPLNIILRFVKVFNSLYFRKCSLFKFISMYNLFTPHLSRELWGYSFPTGDLQKKIAAKIHSWQKYLFFFPIFNILAPIKITACLQMNQERLLIYWLSFFDKVTYLCQFFWDMLVEFPPSLNKTWGVNFTLEIYLILVREIFPSERYYLWDWVRFHAEKGSRRNINCWRSETWCVKYFQTQKQHAVKMRDWKEHFPLTTLNSCILISVLKCSLHLFNNHFSQYQCLHNFLLNSQR